MANEGDRESLDPLEKHRMSREGLLVKLDRGFEKGDYCVYVEFDELSSRVGYAAARHRAGEFCELLKTQLDRFAGHSIGEMTDAIGVGPMQRRKEKDYHHVVFPVVMNNGRFHDNAMLQEFRAALLRAGQQWDQLQARTIAQKLDGRRDAFRVQLGQLLAGDVYQHVDKVTKDRLLDEVPALAFPPRGYEL